MRGGTDRRENDLGGEGGEAQTTVIEQTGRWKDVGD